MYKVYREAGRVRVIDCHGDVVYDLDATYHLICTREGRFCVTPKVGLLDDDDILLSLAAAVRL